MKPPRHFSVMLASRIEATGQSAELLLRPASEILVFGSRAMDLHTDSSDLDVLCVGSGSRVKTPALDLLWMPENSIFENDWLGSELGSHVARYGVCIRGKAAWRSMVFFGDKARTRKIKRINSLLKAVSGGWLKLHPIFRKKYQTTIRREIQRYEHLNDSSPVPPTALLDRNWQLNPNATIEFVERMAICDRTVFAMQLLNASRDQIVSGEL